MIEQRWSVIERLEEIYREEVAIEVHISLQVVGQTTQGLQRQAEGLSPSPGGWLGVLGGL